LLKEMENDFDLVLLDMPPINIVSDPLSVSALVAGCLFVTRQDFSDLRDIRKALISAEMTGMDVVAQIGTERMPATVFVTAYEQYAVRAFEANALDYLVKPLSRERFAATLQRAKARLGGAGNNPAHLLQALDALRQRDAYLQRIAVRVDEHVVFVAVDDIVWIKANRNTVQLHVAGAVHELREPMAALGARLDPRHFARVHRSAIINVRRVKAIHPWFNGHHVVTMDNGQQLRMSRYQHEVFLRLVTNGSGE
jgi:two-component system LytT family response regulator